MLWGLIPHSDTPVYHPKWPSQKANMKSGNSTWRPRHASGAFKGIGGVHAIKATHKSPPNRQPPQPPTNPLIQHAIPLTAHPTNQPTIPKPNPIQPNLAPTSNRLNNLKPTPSSPAQSILLSRDLGWAFTGASKSEVLLKVVARLGLPWQATTGWLPFKRTEHPRLA